MSTVRHAVWRWIIAPWIRAKSTRHMPFEFFWMYFEYESVLKALCAVSLSDCTLKWSTTISQMQCKLVWIYFELRGWTISHMTGRFTWTYFEFEGRVPRHMHRKFVWLYTWVNSWDDYLASRESTQPIAELSGCKQIVNVKCQCRCAKLTFCYSVMFVQTRLWCF